MRYSRVLTVLALAGVVALTTTLLTQGAPTAPKRMRAVAPRPIPPPTPKPSLRSQLLQYLQQIQSPLLARQPQAVSPPFNATPCPVASCSINPCVQFVQGGGQPVSSVQAAPAVAVLPGGPRTQRCNRHALPHTLRVSSAVAPAVSVSAPQPQPAGSS